MRYRHRPRHRYQRPPRTMMRGNVEMSPAKQKDYWQKLVDDRIAAANAAEAARRAALTPEERAAEDAEVERVKANVKELAQREIQRKREREEEERRRRTDPYSTFGT
jgi:hypothetical protein